MSTGPGIMVGDLSLRDINRLRGVGVDVQASERLGSAAYDRKHLIEVLIQEKVAEELEHLAHCLDLGTEHPVMRYPLGTNWVKVSTWLRHRATQIRGRA